MRDFGIPDKLADQIKTVISNLGYSVDRPQELAQEIQALSDHFIAQTGAPTPWYKKQTQAAFLAYYFPITYARVSAVAAEAQNCNFFAGIKHIVDFGSGPGTASLVLEELKLPTTAIDNAPEAIELHKKFNSNRLVKWDLRAPQSLSPGTMVVVSYVLNEIGSAPQWLLEADAIFLVEPSTHQDFPKFLKFRDTLQANGYFFWAPCPHQEVCPLAKSKDWCHDRVKFNAPPWFAGLEKHLPIKNKHVTFSYLLAKKGKYPPLQVGLHRQLTRVIGDPLVEAGKTKQMVCRGAEREFFSWLHKEGPTPALDRGDSLVLDSEPDKHGNELRKLNYRKT